MIADMDIPVADPAAVIEQYEPYIQKLANRYTQFLSQTGAVDIDDLRQAGRLAIAEAQRKYNPENGSFMNALFYYVRSAMRRALGINNAGKLPEIVLSLDEPITDADGNETARIDTIQDPDAVPLDEPIIEAEERSETSEQVRAALARMQSDKQRQAVTLVWMEGKTRQAAADEMEMNHRAFYSLEKAARGTLSRDYRLRKYAETMPFVHVSISRFNSTWTSATEYAALWRLDHLPEIEKDQAYRKEAAERIRSIWDREHTRPVTG